MPIVEVEVIEDARGDSCGSCARALADKLGEVLGTLAGHTWVRLRRLARADYAENASDLPDDLAPVFVSVLEAAPPTGQELAARMSAVAQAVAEATCRPVEQVHVLYEPPALGRIAFGGVLRES